MNQEEYSKYRWFFTSNDILVVGGKSASQNDELIKKIKALAFRDLIIMHTATPGSPFSIILAPITKVTKTDLDETATFTASFSRAWRSQKKTAKIHIFKLSQIYKTSKMKTGTWGVKHPIKEKTAQLKLSLTKQKDKLRAVPEQTAKKSLLKISPGKMPKEKQAIKIQEILNNKFTIEEILQALPAGGLEIEK